MDYGLQEFSDHELDLKERERAAYLRKLKGSNDSSHPEQEKHAEVTHTPERRRSFRYRCDGSAELRQEGSDVRTWGTLADISMHGCYIEMTATYPVGTKLELCLEAVGVRVRAVGEIRIAYPFLGIGVAFGELVAEEREKLRELLQRLSVQGRPAVVEASAIGADGLPLSLPSPENAREMVKELSSFFQNHSVMPQEAFGRILARWTDPH